MSVAACFSYSIKFKKDEDYEKASELFEQEVLRENFPEEIEEDILTIAEFPEFDDDKRIISYEDEDYCSSPLSIGYFTELLKFIVREIKEVNFDAEASIVYDDDNYKERKKFTCQKGELKEVQINPLEWFNDKKYKDLIFVLEPNGKIGDKIWNYLRNILSDCDIDYDEEDDFCCYYEDDDPLLLERTMLSIQGYGDNLLVCMPAYSDVFVEKNKVMDLLDKLIAEFPKIDFKVYVRFGRGKKLWGNNFEIVNGKIVESELDLTASKNYSIEERIVDLDAEIDINCFSSDYDEDYDEEDYDEDEE